MTASGLAWCIPKPKTVDNWPETTLALAREADKAADQGWLASIEKTAFLPGNGFDLQQDCNALSSVKGMIINKSRNRAHSHIDRLRATSETEACMTQGELRKAVVAALSQLNTFDSATSPNNLTA